MIDTNIYDYTKYPVNSSFIKMPFDWRLASKGIDLEKLYPDEYLEPGDNMNHDNEVIMCFLDKNYASLLGLDYKGINGNSLLYKQNSNKGLLSIPEVVAIKRSIAESNPAFKQIVCSYTLTDGESILVQERDDFSDYSLVMGHAMFNENVIKYTIREYLVKESMREFFEEVRTNVHTRVFLNSDNIDKTIFINLNTGDLKQIIHFGIVFIKQVSGAVLESLLEHNKDLKLLSIYGDPRLNYCNWTKKVIESLRK